jgi:hypothetical protein
MPLNSERRLGLPDEPVRGNSDDRKSQIVAQPIVRLRVLSSLTVSVTVAL